MQLKFGGIANWVETKFMFIGLIGCEQVFLRKVDDRWQYQIPNARGQWSGKFHDADTAVLHATAEVYTARSIRRANEELMESGDSPFGLDDDEGREPEIISWYTLQRQEDRICNDDDATNEDAGWMYVNPSIQINSIEAARVARDDYSAQSGYLCRIVRVARTKNAVPTVIE